MCFNAPKNKNLKTEVKTWQKRDEKRTEKIYFYNFYVCLYLNCLSLNFHVYVLSHFPILICATLPLSL